MHNAGCVEEPQRSVGLPPATSPEPLDNLVVSHMLQLPRLTADQIAQSVLEARFDRIYAIYYLLIDKLVARRKESAAAAQMSPSTASFAASRARKTSITTGVVVRDEVSPTFLPPEDRLSPLTNVSFDAPLGGVIGTVDPQIEVTLDLMETSPPATAATSTTATATTVDFLFPNYGQSSATTSTNTRRHTVGPGDVAHEQALQPVQPMYFRPDHQIPNIPTNLPTLQNQPLNLLTIKDQHLLKPPTVMGGNSKYYMATGTLQFLAI